MTIFCLCIFEYFFITRWLNAHMNTSVCYDFVFEVVLYQAIAFLW